ncbi:hypothetical protein FRC15_011219 [Serendipita sp. 397]|nr:hypothetical protein FRC15_011219 [Serendipita sp. 397]
MDVSRLLYVRCDPHESLLGPLKLILGHILHSDTNDNRALGLRIWLDRGMTAPACMDGCFQRGYQFAGVEYADECYCANSIGSSGAVATGGCEMACSGDSATLCGGAGRLNVYKYTGSDLPVAPSVLESYNNYNSQGCYTDAVVSRVLTPQSVSDSMTVETCIDACSAASYSVAGLEYGNECYCGNALPATQATDNCIMNCAGDGEHVCGGPDRLSVYEKQPEQEPEPEPESQWEYFGCRETNPYSKMEFDDTHQTTMTPQLCTSYCDSKSLNVAILVTGGTCVCQPHYGNDLGSACTKPCPGDLTQKCGTTSTFGGSVWIKPPTSVVMVSAPVQNVWSSAGCYSASGAVYWARIYQFNSMTVNYCTNFCYGKGLPIAAISTVPSSSTYPCSIVRNPFYTVPGSIADCCLFRLALGTLLKLVEGQDRTRFTRQLNHHFQRKALMRGDRRRSNPYIVEPSITYQQFGPSCILMFTLYLLMEGISLLAR